MGLKGKGQTCTKGLKGFKGIKGSKGLKGPKGMKGNLKGLEGPKSNKLLEPCRVGKGALLRWGILVFYLQEVQAARL